MTRTYWIRRRPQQKPYGHSGSKIRFNLGKISVEQRPLVQFLQNNNIGLLTWHYKMH